MPSRGRSGPSMGASAPAAQAGCLRKDDEAARRSARDGGRGSQLSRIRLLRREMATETAIDVVMPQMGVSVSEGTITKWLKQEGEHVEADEPLLEISTDKVDTEVPSPGTGTLTQILVQEGQTVDVGTKLAQIGGGGGAPAPQEEAPPPAAEPAAAAPEPAEPQPVAQPQQPAVTNG